MTIGRHICKLAGYAPALPTPFDENDAINAAAFERLCELQISNGATASWLRRTVVVWHDGQDGVRAAGFGVPRQFDRMLGRVRSCPRNNWHPAARYAGSDTKQFAVLFAAQVRCFAGRPADHKRLLQSMNSTNLRNSVFTSKRSMTVDCVEPLKARCSKNVINGRVPNSWIVSTCGKAW